jgi:acyl-CoA synthetase (AMP-forming)/AMP-acid ligase II
MTMSGKTPKYGQRLLINVVDERARDEPERECYSVPRSSDPKDGWRPVTYKQFANAINHEAHKIAKICDPATPGKFPTIAYIGPSDLRYLVVTLAAVKAGCQALLISPRNSLEAQLNLFEATDCHVVYFDPSFQAIVTACVQRREMKAATAEPVEAWFPDEEVPPFPYNKTFAEAEWDPMLVMHTSGTTGLPKPIFVKQGMLAISDKYHNLPEWHGTVTWLQAIEGRAKRTLNPSKWSCGCLWHIGLC